MKLNEDSMREIVERNLNDSSLFIVAIKKADSGNQSKIKIILDGDKGITIDQCAGISRRVGAELDEMDETDNSYVLEVTSPGVDFPLQLSRQYVKNVGRRVKVVLKDRSEKRGVLKSVQDRSIEIESEIKTKNSKKAKSELVEIPFDQIEKTNIQISFK